MNGPSHKSAGISPRRALIEEVLEERSRVVAGLPVDVQDPPASSVLWSFGAVRLAVVARSNSGALRRRAIVELAVVALAWLERFDADAQTQPGRGAVPGGE